MFCNNCGAKLNDNLHHCPKCGAVVTGVRQASAADSSVPERHANDPSAVLFWGILGVVLSMPVCLLGVAFSCVGLYKANRYMNESGEYSRRVSVGRTLSICGVVVGLIVTILLSVAVYLAAKNIWFSPQYV